MSTLLIIIGIHAVLLGFALLFGGFISLVPPSEAEEEASRRAYELARQKSWWHGFVWCLNQATTAKYRGLSMVATHWPQRPYCRKLVYAGLACLAVAAAIGYHFEVVP